MIIQDDDSNCNSNSNSNNDGLLKKEVQFKESVIQSLDQNQVSFGKDIESFKLQQKEQYQLRKTEESERKQREKTSNNISKVNEEIGMGIQCNDNQLITTYSINNNLLSFLSTFRLRAMIDKTINNIKPIHIEYAIVIQPSAELTQPGNNWTNRVNTNNNQDNMINLKGTYSFIRTLKTNSPLVKIIPFVIDQKELVKIPIEYIRENKFKEFASVLIHKIKSHCNSIDVVESISSLYSELVSIDNNSNRFIRIIFFLNRFEQSIDCDDLKDSLSLFNDDIDNINNLKASSLHFILFDYNHPLNEITLNSIRKLNINDYNVEENTSNSNSNSNDYNGKDNGNNGNSELNHILNTSSSIENSIIKLSNRAIEQIKSLLNNTTLVNYIKSIDALIEELYCLYNIIQDSDLKLKNKSMTKEEKATLLSLIEKEIGNKEIIDKIVDRHFSKGLRFDFDHEPKNILEQINANYKISNTLIAPFIKSNQCQYWNNNHKAIKDNYDSSINTINAIKLSANLIEYISTIIKQEISFIIINKE